MNITNSNFKSSLPEVEAAIKSSSFLAIDGEFTGLTSKGYNWNHFDSLEERYEKIKKGCMDFSMIQFGLSTFNVSDDGKCSQKTFNFYVFPCVESTGKVFKCDASSLSFLAYQGFNFSALFKEGISYMKSEEKNELIENIKNKQRDRSPLNINRKSDRQPIPIPDENKEFIEKVCGQVKDFIAHSDDKDKLKLEQCNSFLRLLLFQEIRRRFKDVFVETETTDKKEKVMFVIKCNPEEQMRIQEERNRLELEEAEDAEGFCKVINMISNSGTLVVGHNMVLDLCHILNQFVCDLPETFAQFKDLMKKTFPRILDTKLMASNPPFIEKINDTSLSKLVSSLRQKPFVIPEVTSEVNKSYSLEDKLHEAGYDAYITGLSFLTMIQYLSSLKKSDNTFDFKLAKTFTSKLFLQGVHDIPYINLQGEDVEPSRDHVFHVSFPKTWRRQNILDLFSPFGRVMIAWIDDESAWVGLVDRSQASGVTRRLTSPTVTVVEYNKYKGIEKSTNKRTLPLEIEAPTKKQRNGSLVRESSFEAIPEEVEHDHHDENSKK